MSKLLTRRNFLIGGATLGVATVGVLTVGVGYLATLDIEGLEPELDNNGTAHLNAWISITPDNIITLAVPRTEMGQGAFTGNAMLIAEELGVDVNAKNVNVVHPVEELPVYTNFAIPLADQTEPNGEVMHDSLVWLAKRVFASMPYIGAGASATTVDAWMRCRKAGAVAQNLLLRAAAQGWGISIEECTVDNGIVFDKTSSRQVTFGEVATRAAALQPTTDIKLKAPEDWTLIGRSKPRVDIPSKVNGSAVYGIDIRPGRHEMSTETTLLFGAVVMSPTFGAVVKTFDDTVTSAANGVLKIVQGPNFIGVIGDSWWSAKNAAQLLDITWSESDSFNTAARNKALSEALETKNATVITERGNTNASLSSGEKMVEATYQVPFAAHGSMEPLSATALVHEDGHLELWSSIQSPLNLRLAGEAGMKLMSKKIQGQTVTHIPYAGGRFGGGSESPEGIQAAAMAAMVPGSAVQVIWSRDQFTKQASVRSDAMAKIRAVLGKNGLPKALVHRTVTQSLVKSYVKRNMSLGGFPAGFDPFSIEGAEGEYNIPSVRYELVDVPSPVPIGFWRSNGFAFNSFFTESFIDECAHAANIDSIEYRMALIKSERSLNVLRTLREKSGWDSPRREGSALGCAFVKSYSTRVGIVAEVSNFTTESVRIDRITAVVDCGRVVNPNIARSQIEGAIIWGQSQGLFSRITFDEGAVQQSYFGYRNLEVTTLATAPREIKVHFVESKESPTGIGEPGVAPTAPAIANAIFAATGKRLRHMPILRPA